MLLSFDETGDLLDALAETFPEALFRDLNGGVSLLPEAVPDPDFPPGEVFVMGEFCDDMMGRYINLYYGSFAALAEREDWTRADWEEELRVTLAHELTHHIEGLAGERGLDAKDEEELARLLEAYEDGE